MEPTVIYPEIEALRYLIKEQKEIIETLKEENSKMRVAIQKCIEWSSVREYGWENILPECLAQIDSKKEIE